MSGLQLNFGAGQNLLPDPWQNLNGAHDIRKPLRFESGSVKWILAEHVVEHVSFLQGVAFFQECLRVLEPGGVLRVAFPDVSRFVEVDRRDRWTDSAHQYAEHMTDRRRLLGLLEPIDNEPIGVEHVKKEMLQMLTGWGHQMAWTRASAGGVLLAIGFRFVQHCEYGFGEVFQVDGHHKDVGHAIAKLETTVLEAHK